MATKSTKYKYSRAKRILIAVFALFFTILFILNLIDISTLTSNFIIQDFTNGYNVYDSYEFSDQLYNDVNSILYSLDSASRQSKYENKYSQICDEVETFYNEGCTISENFKKEKEKYAEDNNLYWNFAEEVLDDYYIDASNKTIYQAIKENGLTNRFWTDVLNEYISDNYRKFYETYIDIDNSDFSSSLYYDGEVYANIIFDEDEFDEGETEENTEPLYFSKTTDMDEYLASVGDEISASLSNIYSKRVLKEKNMSLSELLTMKFYAEGADGKIVTNCKDESDILSIINNSSNAYYIYYSGENDSKLKEIYQESDYNYHDEETYSAYSSCSSNFSHGNLPYRIHDWIEDYYDAESTESGQNVKFIFAFYVSPYHNSDDQYGEIEMDYYRIHNGLTFKFEYPLTYLVYIVASAAALIILFIITLKMAGHKGNDMVRTKIDVIPWPIHLIVSLVLVGLLIWAILFLIVGFSEFRRYYTSDLSQTFYSGVWSYILTVIAAYVALLLFDETSVSIARKIKVKNRFHKKIDTAKLKAATMKDSKAIKHYSVLFGKMIRKTAKSFGIWFIKFSKAFVGKCKEIALSLYKFTFKHNHISTRSLLLLLLLLIVTDLLMVLGIVFLIIPLVFLGIIFILLSIVCFIFFVWSIFNFINQFDSIVETIENRAEITGDYEKLPESLKILSEYYTENEKNLKEAISEAVKSEQMKAELITNVSHDLKTPLTSIINYADLLNGLDIEDETEKKYVSVIYDKSLRLKKLIEDLIEVSKVSTGNVSIHKAVLNLNELTEQAVTDEAADLDKYDLELVLNDCEDNVTVWADGEKIYRVYQNLFSNVKKYSAPGTRVYASIYSDDCFGYFELKNISKTQLNITPEKLFERFTRADKSRSEEGNGLGLSIAKELCNLNGGELILKIDGDLFKVIVKLPKYDTDTEMEK